MKGYPRTRLSRKTVIEAPLKRFFEANVGVCDNRLAFVNRNVPTYLSQLLVLDSPIGFHAYDGVLNPNTDTGEWPNISEWIRVRGSDNMRRWLEGCTRGGLTQLTYTEQAQIQNIFLDRLEQDMSLAELVMQQTTPIYYTGDYTFPPGIGYEQIARPLAFLTNLINAWWSYQRNLEQRLTETEHRRQVKKLKRSGLFG